MSKKGPPKFFDTKPKAPSKVPLPSGWRRPRPAGGSGAGGGGGKRPAPSATRQGKSGGGWFAGGESWKTYVVLVVSVVLLAGVMVVYVSRSFEAMDREKAVAEMGLLAATLQTIDREMGGFRLAESERTDAAILDLLREVAAGGDLSRNDDGEITGVEEADAGAERLFVQAVPGKSVAGTPFHFVLPEPDMEGGPALPAIEVEGIGTLRPPEEGAEDRWVFDGDLTHVHRSSEAGGEIVPVNIKKGNGESLTLTIFKPRAATSEEPEGSEGT